MDEDVLPSDYEAECQLLGCLLVNNTETLDMVCSELDVKDFSDGVNALVFQRISEMYSEFGSAIDQQAIGTFLKHSNYFPDDEVYKNDFERIGGWSGLTTNYIEQAAYPQNAHLLVQTLRNLRIKRDAFRRLNTLQYHAGNGKTPQELIDGIDNLHNDLEMLVPAQANNDLAALCDSVIAEMQTRIDKTPGVKTGFTNLDRMTFGFQPGQFIVIGGVPGSYKTALALTFTHRHKLESGNWLFISLEMTKEQLIERLFCQMTEISSEQFKLGHIDQHVLEKLQEAKRRIVDLDLVILDDTDKLNKLGAIEAAITRRKRAGKKLDGVIVDHIQLLTAKGARKDSDRQREVEENSRGLKAMAKRHGLPIVALSQLSRVYAGRKDKRPQMSDLRDSGAIEQDADLVMFTYYEPLHNPDTHIRDCVELIVAKQRSGQTGKVYLHLRPEYYGLYDAVNEFYKPDYGAPAPKKPPAGSTYAANNQTEGEEDA